MRKNNLAILLLLFISLIISIPLILPYFHPGFFPTQDGEWAVVRLGDMYRELKDLQFPPRYSGNLNFGYGYPLFEFAYPLPYYLGFFIHLLHINFVDSIKILFALSVPLSFLFMYLLSNKLWGNKWIAFTSAILYIYYPYRIVDLYVRGSIGESFAFILFPLIFYFILNLHRNKHFFSAIFASIFIAALVMSHNIMAVEFLPIIIVTVFISVWSEKKERKKLILNYLLMLILSFGLSAFFWLPALSEKNLIALSITPIADMSLYFVKPFDLLFSSWGFGTNNFSHQLGFAQLIIVFLLLFSLFFKKNATKSEFSNFLFWGLGFIFIIYLFLLFSPSLILWKSLPLFNQVTYPWTLLAVMGFLISLFAGRIFILFPNKVLIIILGVVAVLSVVFYAHPSIYVNRGDGFYLTNDATTTSSDEYTPIWVKQKPLLRPAQKFVDASANLSQEISNSKKFSVVVDSSKESLLQINTIYYPGWKTFVDNQSVAISDDNPQGLIEISVSSGHHIVNGTFTETPLRLFADIVSVISFISCFVFLALPLINKRKQK
ncbi:MAG TPA: 6-pyruvoyl-tetrahydropterin synthase-related protein [Patescibacteria group bacterium]|nr:6-pyruvoyl-tetrahydropterin synthase-related protein [Patescibacteria group bacterium]